MCGRLYGDGADTIAGSCESERTDPSRIISGLVGLVKGAYRTSLPSAGLETLVKAMSDLDADADARGSSSSKKGRRESVFTESDGLLWDLDQLELFDR